MKLTIACVLMACSIYLSLSIAYHGMTPDFYAKALLALIGAVGAGLMVQR